MDLKKERKINKKFIPCVSEFFNMLELQEICDHPRPPGRLSPPPPNVVSMATALPYQLDTVKEICCFTSNYYIQLVQLLEKVIYSIEQ